MNIKSIHVLLFVFTFTTALSFGECQTITFPSKDGIEITGNLYMVNTDKATPFIVLFHQAKWSRGEYLETAPKLNELGFNCMAVDQRSGNEINGLTNETAKRARSAGERTTYVDALPDMEASLKYARRHYANGCLLVWGSSYSAALVLKIAGDKPELVDGALAFSPGEYFVRMGKPKTWIRSSAKNIRCPVFICSAKNERNSWTDIFEAIPADTKVLYLPSSKGNHGSRALWGRFKDSEGYWNAVKGFLKKNF